MKNYSNKYCYKQKYDWDEESRKSTVTNEKLDVLRNGRFYKTKMDVSDLPEYFCDVRRYTGLRDVINAKDVKHIMYSWVKENHFMKDSILYISYGDEIVTKPMTYFTFDGVEHESVFTYKENADEMIFGYDIIKFLAYLKKYSQVDITEVKDEFINQCNWLKENEPEFAPDADDFGTWFDNKISEFL